MTNILFALTLVVQFQSLHEHTSYKIDSAKYICAYNYIKDNTTAKRIRISRCIVDLDRWVFPIDSLTDYPEEKNALIAFVERKKNERNKENFSDEITIQTPIVRRPQNILFFFSNRKQHVSCMSVTI